jgi:hypothetical protein
MHRIIGFRAGSFMASEGVSGVIPWLDLSERYRSVIGDMGLLVLSNLAKGPACKYEQDLLEGLLVYGRACYQLDPVDKLLQIMTALEMFALRGDSEPITSVVGDRLAFAIGAEAGARQTIAKNFKVVYAIRSGRTHHGRTIAETAQIETFLQHAWEFFLIAIKGVGRYRRREEFLDHLDAVKYGK